MKSEKEHIELELSLGKLFDLYLTGRGISSKWVADSLDVHPSLISKIRREKWHVTNKMRASLNELLETSY